MATLDAAAGRDARVIALVCIPHMLSHAYYLVLPPLVPVLKDALGLSYTDFGLALTVFGLAAGFGQIPVGFLVDWLGGRRLLILGMAVQVPPSPRSGWWTPIGSSSRAWASPASPTPSTTRPTTPS